MINIKEKAKAFALKACLRASYWLETWACLVDDAVVILTLTLFETNLYGFTVRRTTRYELAVKEYFGV